MKTYKQNGLTYINSNDLSDILSIDHEIVKKIADEHATFSDIDCTVIDDYYRLSCRGVMHMAYTLRVTNQSCDNKIDMLIDEFLSYNNNPVPVAKEVSWWKKWLLGKNQEEVYV